MRPGLHDAQCKESFSPDDENSESDVDDEYKLFLDNLREDGCSYVLEMSPLCVRYEAEDEPFGRDAIEARVDPDIDLREQGHAACKEKLTNSDSGGDVFSSNLVKHLRLGEIDPCYRVFLCHVRVRDGYVFLNLDNGITIKYGEEIESPNTSTTIKATPPHVKEPELQANSSMPFGSFDDATSTENSSSCKISYFTRGLQSFCDRQFNQDEYEHLLEEFSTCKPIEKHKHLRGITKTYQTRDMSKSYFDHFPDFYEQIRIACCPNYCLKQLRGFMFWLKNLCHEGAFKPWENELFSSCGNCG